MTLQTAGAFVASITASELEAQILSARAGKLTRYPLVRPSLQAVAATYGGVHSPDHRSLFGGRLSPTGGEINHSGYAAHSLVLKSEKGGVS